MFEPFDLSVLLGPENRVWVSAVSNAGAVHGVPRGGGAVPSLGELQDLADDFLDAIATAAPQPGLDLGRALKEILFGEPEILGLFHHTRGVAADHGRQLLVRVLAAPRELTAVPWELTLDPDEGIHQYLTLAPYAHLVRAARSRTYPVRTDPLAPPLNLLVILSSPLVADEDLTFDLFEEKRNLLNELRPLEDARLLNIDVEEHPTLENLQRKIGGRRDGYHLVHYLGHALPTALLLEDRYGRSRSVEPEVMNALLRLCPNLRLVLFAGCETARAPDLDVVTTDGAVADWRIRLSTADRCVRDSCPVVIGMQAVLPFRTEWLFTRFFYQAITAGYSIAEAARLARVAIRRDDYVGGDRLDWAVPSLVVAGGFPGPLVEAGAATQPPIARVPREELKLGLVELDLDFFSRLIPLRLAVDVLTGETPDRLLVVTGPKGVGKTSLIDRVLEDIGDRVDFVLYANAREILASDFPDDIVMALSSWVAELLDRRDDRRRRPAEGWDGSAWWSRLAQELAGRRFVIVIDGIDELPNDPELGAALSALVNRRSRCRIALVGGELPPNLLDAEASERAAHVRLTPFTWDEVWRWIRRNHPVLTRYGKAGLAAYYPRLGAHLDLWAQLAEQVSVPQAPASLDDVVDHLGPPRAPTPAPTPADLTLPRSKRPLRVAVAGPFVRDPALFAVALTDWAANYQVGGRALVPGEETSSSLAVLLAVDTPFGDGGASEAELTAWIDGVVAQKPDIVVLDYGADEIGDAHLVAVRDAARESLVIAAAGNTGARLAYPARAEEVLAIGALDQSSEIAVYSSREPRRRKPELFAPGTLGGTPLQRWLGQGESPDGTPMQGTSMAAYQAAAAAIVVWATNPERDPGWVRAVLQETATELPSKYKRFRPRALDVRAALDRAREDLVVDTLGLLGRSSLAELLAGVGLLGTLTDAALDRLVARGRVIRTRTGSTERYEAAA